MGGRVLDLPMKTVKGGGPTSGMGKVPILKRWIKEKDWEGVMEKKKSGKPGVGRAM